MRNYFCGQKMLMFAVCVMVLLGSGCNRESSTSPSKTAKTAESHSGQAARPPEQPAHTSQGLEGRWKQLYEEVDGQRVPDRPVAVVMEISGDKVTITAGNRLAGDGTIHVDTSQNPPTIDLHVTSRIGGTAGRTTDSYGIYELSGNTLTICSAGNADHRPKSIPPAAGSGAVTHAYQRVP
jgi:uncharacterized protein (TIGR03067 family)